MPAKRLGRLGRLSPGESLLIARRRRELRKGGKLCRVTQHDASETHGTTLGTYGLWERDAEPPIGLIKPVGRLTSYERCLIYRRRVSMSQMEVAREMRRSRAWINQMECGVVPCDELLCYWEK